MSIGGYYIPNIISLDGYWERVKYFGGIHYVRSFLNLQEQRLYGYGLNMGLSMPVKRESVSNLVLGVDLGSFGTTEDKLVHETYVKFNLQISLNDSWFAEKKYY